MRLRASVRDRLAVFSRILPVLALPLIVLGAAPAAAEQSKREQLEQRLLETVRMFQSDPRYNRGKTPEQIRDSAEFVTGNVLFVLAHEASHAMISEFAIPVVGREEDAADSLASLGALRMANSFPARIWSRPPVSTVRVSFNLQWKPRTRPVPPRRKVKQAFPRPTTMRPAR